MRELKFRSWNYAVGMSEPFSLHDIVNGGQLTDTIMQFTGLKDKRGIEIYEGDILHNDEPRSIYSQKGNNIYTVEWNKVGWCAKGKNGRYDVYPPLDFKSSWGVIGNIYENPDFLERKS